MSLDEHVFKCLFLSMLKYNRDLNADTSSSVNPTLHSIWNVESVK